MPKREVVSDLADKFNMKYGGDKEWLKKNLLEVDQYFLDYLNKIIK